MPALSLRDIPEQVYARLKEQASANRRSLNAEVLVILERATRSRRLDADALLNRIDGVRARLELPTLTDEFVHDAKRHGRP